MITSIKLVAKFYLPYFFNHKRLFIIPILFSVFMACYESFSPYAIKLLIDRIGVIDDQDAFWLTVLWPALGYVFLTELANMMFRARDWFKLRVLPDIKSSIMLQLYTRLLNQSYAYFQDHSVGTLSNKIDNLVKGAETMIGFLSDVVLWRILSIFIAGCMITSVSLTLTVFIFIWGISFIALTLKLSHASHIHAIGFSKSRGALSGVIADAFTNILEVLLFQNASYEKNRLSQQLESHKKQKLKMFRT